jgi:ABC-2 type transport system ATP-binding protein
MISNPKILFLDEPTVGLDVESRKILWQMIKKIRDEFGTTVFLTTHYLEEADELSDTICIIKDGHEIVQGTPESLRGYLKQDRIRIGFENSIKADNCKKALVNAALLKKEKIKTICINGTCITIETENLRNDFISVNKWLLEQAIDFISFEVFQPTLEDVFLSFTKQDDRGEVNEYSQSALA